ncbi:calcium-binding protein [Falsigemmobacter faecalis]|uniref:Calcium-binding protein n=1 Tax=Falsigemmobacter faecalis TaxID=2488730 RepID=A0A3P3DUR3_9RHOB|nr:calcium-binding protein [Falsigemmobacter faecalis]RRH78037.1 calcium-binding protein [Falsigemmobacter faecalis]
MLELLGLVGLLVAGAVGSAIFPGDAEHGSGEEEDDTPEPEAEPGIFAETSEPAAEGMSEGGGGASQPDPVPEAGGASDPASSRSGAWGPESSDLSPPPEERPLTLTGGPQDSQIFGGAQGDTLTGGEGNDTLTGGGGADRMAGGAGSDHLAGQEGDDHLEGGSGDDTLLGGRGDDLLISGGGNSWLSGGMGQDVLVAGSGNDTLDGDEGADTLSGNLGQAEEGTQRYLNGGRGDDLLHAGGGDVASGGEGADVFRLTGTGAAQIMDFGTEDSLLIEYAANAPAPVISYEAGENGLRVLADGQVLADLIGVHDPDVVRLTLSAV